MGVWIPGLLLLNFTRRDRLRQNGLGEGGRRVKASLGLRALAALLSARSRGKAGGVGEATAQTGTRKRAQAVWGVGCTRAPAGCLPKLSWFQL